MANKRSTVKDLTQDRNKGWHNIVQFYMPFFTAMPDFYLAFLMYTFYRSKCDSEERCDIGYKELSKVFGFDNSTLRSQDLFLQSLGLIKFVNGDRDDGLVERRRVIVLNPLMIDKRLFKELKESLARKQNVDINRSLVHHGEDIDKYRRIFHEQFPQPTYAFNDLLNINKVLTIRRMYPDTKHITLDMISKAMGLDTALAKQFIEDKKQELGQHFWKKFTYRVRYRERHSQGLIDFFKVSKVRESFFNEAEEFDIALNPMGFGWTIQYIFGYYCDRYKHFTEQAPDLSDKMLDDAVPINETSEYKVCSRILSWFISRGETPFSTLSSPQFIEPRNLAFYIDYSIVRILDERKMPSLFRLSEQISIHKFQCHMAEQEREQENNGKMD